VVVLAGGRDAVRFAKVQGVALQAVRGQVSTLPATARSRALNSVVCGCGYATPVWGDSHCIGASYGPANSNEQATPTDDAQNVANLRRYFPALATALEAVPATGRVAFRAVSPDRLPLVGPVPAADAFRACYGDLHHGRDPSRYSPAPYQTGLFINAGHGSRGLVSAALAAEVLAALLEEEPLPLARPLLHALHPARFLIRELRKAPPSG
jgi:tRNA 5-methylaminomethyl-2-thiouridine biosynthesis bifunctional protein